MNEKGRIKLVDAINAEISTDPQISRRFVDIWTAPQRLQEGEDIEYFTLRDPNALFAYPILNAISNAGFMYNSLASEIVTNPDQPIVELIDIDRSISSNTHYTFRDHNFPQSNK